MKEEVNKDEESLEDIIEEMNEEELDKKLEETFKEDILSESEVKTKFTHMNTLVENSSSALKERESMSIENLEDKLKENDEDEEKNILESQEIITYGIDEDDIFDSHYVKPESQGLDYVSRKRDSNNVEDAASISSEMAFVKKNMKPDYVKPRIFDAEKKSESGENKFIQDFRKLSDDYKSQ